MKWLALIVTATLFAGCAGELEMLADGEDVTWDGVTPTNPDGTPRNPDGPVIEEITSGFHVERNEVRLLPFHVRMEKLSRVTGLPTTDPMFDRMMTSRYDLGDHNYGQGIGADLSWNASKMETWVRALQPLCASEAMAMRYNLPQDTQALVVAAYGREPETGELDEISGAMSGQTLDEAGAYEAVCLTVLTSAEFVAL